MAAPVFIICRSPKKLKHMALREIHCQLLNTCLIIPCASWKVCCCYKFYGCRLKPIHQSLPGERNYCFICQIRIAYHMDKIYKIDKITDVFNTYLKLKVDLQIYLDYRGQNFLIYDYSQKFYYGNRKRKFNKTYNKLFALKNYIKESYYNLCYYNP